MMDQALMKDALAFLGQAPLKRSRRARARRRERSDLDDIMEILYPEPIKPPDDQPGAGSESADAGAADGSLKLTQVVQRLRQERQAQALSLGDIHDATNITCGRLSRLENGVETNPTIGTLERIAEALGLRLRVTFVYTEE
jgi:hypothetical protein